MLRIATVLRSGGEYRPEHVYALEGLCHRFAPYHDFICFTDQPLGVLTEELRHDWPGWWAKIELFRVPHDGPTLYLDLDTVVTGDLTDVVRAIEAGGWVMLEDMWKPPGPHFGSGVMGWTERMGRRLRNIYEIFKERPKALIDHYSSAGYGDQAWITHLADRGDIPTPEKLQSLVAPGAVRSFKIDGPPLPETVLQVFHGSPRPWHLERTDHAWLPDYS